jgi:hypothetical protein
MDHLEKPDGHQRLRTPVVCRCATRQSRQLARDFRQMETLDPANAERYKKANQYETLTGNRHFWCSDFQVQRTPDYYFSVKMCSDRVAGAESCNSENLCGYYLGDGATYLYQSGKEYENIFPFWDWKKIPGTTTQQDSKELPVLTAAGYRLPTDFVGGVSGRPDRHRCHGLPARRRFGKESLVHFQQSDRLPRRRNYLCIRRSGGNFG